MATSCTMLVWCVGGLRIDFGHTQKPSSIQIHILHRLESIYLAYTNTHEHRRKHLSSLYSQSDQSCCLLCDCTAAASLSNIHAGSTTARHCNLVSKQRISKSAPAAFTLQPSYHLIRSLSIFKPRFFFVSFFNLHHHRPRPRRLGALGHAVLSLSLSPSL